MSREVRRCAAPFVLMCMLAFTLAMPNHGTGQPLSVASLAQPQWNYLSKITVETFLRKFEKECVTEADLRSELKHGIQLLCSDVHDAFVKINGLQPLGLFWMEFNFDLIVKNLKEIAYEVRLETPPASYGFFLFPSEVVTFREVPVVGIFREIVIKSIGIKLAPPKVTDYKITSYGKKQKIFRWVFEAGPGQSLKPGTRTTEALIYVDRNTVELKGTVAFCKEWNPIGCPEWGPTQTFVARKTP